MKTLGYSLRNAREEKNLTQREVAKRTGINNKTISNYENDVSMPDPITLKTFAEIYETTVDYLLGRPEHLEDHTDRKRDRFLDLSGLPDEAVRQVEEYVGFLRFKYKSESAKTSKFKSNKAE